MSSPTDRHRNFLTECQSDSLWSAPPEDPPTVRGRSQPTVSGSNSMDCVKSDLRTAAKSSSSRDDAGPAFSLGAAKEPSTTAVAPQRDRMFSVASPGSPRDIGTVCDLLLSRNIVTGPLANSTMTLRMHVRGGSIDGALTYVAGRPSSLRLANGVVIDIGAKTVTNATTLVPIRFEDLSHAHHGTVLAILRGLNRLLAP
jgi:hypothetical protein